jgi:hypothetical protein
VVSIQHQERNKCLFYLLGLLVAGDDEAKVLLPGGGARPPVRMPVGFNVVEEVDLVFALVPVGSFGRLELFFESFFFRLPNILAFEGWYAISGKVDNPRGPLAVWKHCPRVASEIDIVRTDSV